MGDKQTIEAIKQHIDIWLQILKDKTKSDESKIEVMDKLLELWKIELNTH